MKRTKKSSKKISLILLFLAVTIVMLITATYAWFSTQRDVEITGMRINVEVAESMQISLNGERWVQSIEIADMRQLYGTYDENANVHSFPIYQADEDDNTNYVPTELLPVSTAGEISGGKLQFVKGVVVSNADGTSSLTNITKCNENDILKTSTVEEREDGKTISGVTTKGNEDHPYLVFDMYLRNISAKTSGEDELKLDEGSKVWIKTSATTEQEGVGVNETGLEYSARVGMIVYENTIGVTEGDSGGQTIGERIRGLNAAGTEVVAIWEPNYKEHTQYVVWNNGRGITQLSQVVSTYGIKTSAEGGEIADINATSGTHLREMNTFKPIYTTVEGGTTTEEVITNIANANVGLKPNQISKVRVYIWLEGQDPDCIDLASTGDKLNINLKFTKDQTTTTTPNTYEGDGVTTPATTTYTAATLPTSAYGGTIDNYELSGIYSTVSDWRIFHSDGSNVYLISDSYVRRALLPTGKSNGTVDAGDNEYKLGLSGILDDYPNGSEDIASSLRQKLLSGYTDSSDSDNMRATAYLLDTNRWADFKDGTFANYAIGTPTLELFAESYNKLYPDKQIEAGFEEGDDGYRVRWSTGGSSSLSITGVEATDGLYISNSANASGMWLASPSDDGANMMMSLESTDFKLTFENVDDTNLRTSSSNMPKTRCTNRTNRNKYI